MTYTLSEMPKFSYLCQCSQCQKASGSGHSALFMMHSEAVEMNGPLKYFVQTSAKGNSVGRAFCVECGTPLALKSTKYPDLLFFTAASLEDSSVFRPTQVLWNCERQPWDTVDPNLKLNQRGV